MMHTTFKQNRALQQLAQRFYAQPRREQIMLLTASACVLLYTVWFALVVPLQEAVKAERARTLSVSRSLARVESLAASVAQANQQQTRESQKPLTSIAELVDRSLRDNGLVMRGFQPSSDGEARLRLDNVPYDRLLQWLHDLETVQGVQIRELATSASSTAGRVMVNVRLRKE